MHVHLKGTINFSKGEQSFRNEIIEYEKSQRSDSDDYRNGYKTKQINSSYGSMDIQIPQNRKSTFDPQVVKKRQEDIFEIDQKIASMYAKGMTTRQIYDTLQDIYGQLCSILLFIFQNQQKTEKQVPKNLPSVV